MQYPCWKTNNITVELMVGSSQFCSPNGGDLSRPLVFGQTAAVLNRARVKQVIRSLINGLGEETRRSILQCADANHILSKSRNENERQSIPQRLELRLQLVPACSWHLHIGDHAP
jgi:hypothetical protein